MLRYCFQTVSYVTRNQAVIQSLLSVAYFIVAHSAGCARKRGAKMRGICDAAARILLYSVDGANVWLAARPGHHRDALKRKRLLSYV